MTTNLTPASLIEPAASKFPLVRNIPDNDRITAASVAIYKAPVCMGGGNWVEGFRIVRAHRCWTGGENLSIVQDDTCETYARAVEIAREMVSSF